MPSEHPVHQSPDEVQEQAVHDADRDSTDDSTAESSTAEPVDEQQMA